MGRSSAKSRVARVIRSCEPRAVKKLESGHVKVFGCRPTMTAPRTLGPASANLQGRCYGAAARILHPSLLM